MKSFFVFVFIFIFSINDLLVLAVDSFFQTCSVPKACGDQTIAYPFYIKGLQQPYCGYPGFEISCDAIHGRPILNLSGTDYFIRRISYQTQSLVVSNAALASAGNCIPPIRNLSLSSDSPFRLAAGDDRVILFYNCSAVSLGVDLGKYRLGCDGAAAGASVLVVPEGDGAGLAAAARRCGAGGPAAVPVMGFEEGEGLREVMSRGFGLNWIAGDCEFCNQTGGKCGFDYITHHFKCFCPDRPHAARCDPLGHDDKLTLKIGLGVGLSLGLVAAAFFLCWRYKRKRDASKAIMRNISDACMNSDTELGSIYYGVSMFSYKDLQEATNNFDSEKELGDGGFGTVYHGVLKDGREVAVKRLYEHNYRRLEQFTNEIEILTRLRHRNLVSLYGCTSRRSRELLLVYEYVPNGTVADHLHGDRAQTSPLTWPVRLSIATETAAALAYLHASDTVHRDVKTNNILLDASFGVKVADFGLSRLFPGDVTHVSTAPQGTPGYVDPEYHQCYQLTSKSDVYSFGVVLIELISSMPAVDITRHRHEINLASFATAKIQRRAYTELVDLSLGFESDEKTRAAVVAVAELAFRCLQHDNETRPTMREALEELRRIEAGNPEEFDSPAAAAATSPECDEVGLLKGVRDEPPSPDTVTRIWHSGSSTTPNISS